MEINGKKAHISQNHRMAYTINKIIKKITNKEEKDKYNIGAGYRLIEVDWYFITTTPPLFYKTEEMVISKSMIY